MFKDKLVQTSLLVLLGHGLVLSGAYFSIWPDSLKRVQPQKLAVQTIFLQKDSFVVASANANPPPAKRCNPPPISESQKIQPPEESQQPKSPKVQEPAKMNASGKQPPAKVAVPAARQPGKVAKPGTKKPIEITPPKNTKAVQTVASDVKKQHLSSSGENAKLARLKDKQLVLALAREKIAKIQLKGDKRSPAKQPISTLAKVESLSIDQITKGSSQESGSMEASYQEELAYCLKRHLRLIEEGDVQIKLTLDKKGAVVQFHVVYADSRSNRELIEKELPYVLFPAWDQRLTNQQTYTCCVTLSHDQLFSY